MWIKKLKIKPLSVNKCWQGRRFKTPDYKSYETELVFLIKMRKLEKVCGFVTIDYHFYLKNFKMSDAGNFEKPLTDIIVKSGLIDDDRFIKKMTLEKFQCIGNDEYIEINIDKYEEI